MSDVPSSLSAEKGVLGSILYDCDKIHDVRIRREWFTNQTHRNIWDAMIDITNSKKVWDVLLFVEYLKREGLLSKCGGYEYLSELQDPVYSLPHLSAYCRDVEETFNLRNEIAIFNEAIETARGGASASDDVIAALMKKPIERSFSNDDIFKDWKMAQSGERVTIPTPYPSIDRQTGGIRQGMVTIFTGRSKSGKSMFLAHWYNFLGQQGIPILSVPLEDKREITIKRMAANVGNYSNSVLDAGGRFVRVNDGWQWDPVKDYEIKKGVECIKRVSEYPVHFWDRKCTPKQLRGIAIRYKKKHDIQAMFVDGAKDLLRPSGKYGDVGFDEEISQNLCAIAEELDIAVIAVHHLTKLQEEERISVNHIRGSGNIVSDSRAVYALQSNVDGLVVSQNYDLEFDEEGRSKMRVFECLSNNHGGVSHKCLVADLGRCQFKEAIKNVDK